eukprot:GFKZ01006474.1.p1 GENE.GFKZ01006474.1~~GFKZ01006474.1.p1  ORF type:complete len:578 (-),score=75.33 GFKZ01006474.1:316-2049(-)
MTFISPCPTRSVGLRDFFPATGITQIQPKQRAVRTYGATFACVPVQRSASLQSPVNSTENESDTPFPKTWEGQNWEPLSLAQLQALQRKIPKYFYEMKNLCTALLDDNPPCTAEIRPVIHQVNNAALQLQAHTKRPFPGYREFTEVLTNLDASYYHPHFVAYLMSLDGPTGKLFSSMYLMTSALVRHSQLDVPVKFDDYPPRHLVDTLDTLDHFTGVKIPGLTRLCNCYWLCVPWNALRAHQLFKYLPEVGSAEVERVESLSLLRQDSEAFMAAYDAIPLHASSVWRILGFGEKEAASKFGEWLPNEYVGHGHALAGWRALLGGDGEAGDGFERRFEHLHVPNAIVSYLEAMQEWFKGVGLVSYAPAVRVFERGLHVRVLKGFGVVGSSAVGRVLRRREEDFWGWAERTEGCVIGKTERVYRRTGKEASFAVVGARRKLDVVSFVEAQITMLVQGEDIRWVDVVWHGVLGGMSTFRVLRDEEFLRCAGEFAEEFQRKFTGQTPRPPPAGFQAGALFERLADRAVLGCQKAERMFNVDRVVDELRVGLWRQRFTPEKFSKGNSRPFFRDFGNDDDFGP